MKILFACGGTGGDIFPAVAVAQALLEKKKEVEIVFVGTKRGLEGKIIGQLGWRLEMIETATFADKKGLKKMVGLFPFWKALLNSWRLLKKERPAMVVGVGGYVAAPLLILAFFMNIPALSIEPNAVPGLANRVIRYFVKEVVTGYPGMEKYFGSKTRPWGVPVRKSLLIDALSSKPSDKKVIFVFGGSLGAKNINEGVLASLPHLSHLREKIHFIHQVGAQADCKAVEEIYRKSGFSAEVYPFIEKMGLFYGRADFVISRAGANTVAEVTALKKPSLLIPYPHARGGHQAINARALEKTGGAKVLFEEKMSGEKLAGLIQELLSAPDRLAKMSANLGKLRWTNAAERISEECLNLTSTHTHMRT